MRYIDDPDFNVEDLAVEMERLRDRFASPPTISGRTLFRPRLSPPARIYKYTSLKNAHLILDSATLKYTQSEQLDDIFEESPSRDDIRRLMPEYEDGPTIVVDISDSEDRLVTFDRVKQYRADMRRNGVVLSDDIPIINFHGVDRGWKYELGNRPFKFEMERRVKPLALSLRA